MGAIKTVDLHREIWTIDLDRLILAINLKSVVLIFIGLVLGEAQKHRVPLLSSAPSLTFFSSHLTAA